MAPHGNPACLPGVIPREITLSNSSRVRLFLATASAAAAITAFAAAAAAATATASPARAATVSSTADSPKTTMTTPPPALLQRMTCTSADNCVAVGTTSDLPGQAVAAAHWGGDAWQGT